MKTLEQIRKDNHDLTEYFRNENNRDIDNAAIGGLIAGFILIAIVVIAFIANN